ncbi:MAG: Bacterial SH3 domain [Rhodobacteraceae bacterium HLUCCA08]|nr:MAG: Bacterial SH3 domain [Rhodobacteraceae bacterium HLUCCA08]
MIRALAIAFTLLAGAAQATIDAWPALHDVTGVAADDVLNIRAEPNAAAPIIGTFAHDATDVEVIRDNAAGWGLVNVGERTGWVSLAYLRRHPNQFQGYVPPIRTCFGTEPFWSLHLTGEDLRFDRLGEAPVTLPDYRMHQPMSRFENIMIEAGTGDARIVGALRHEFCSDGMSDGEYGLSLTFLRGSGDGAEAFSGCCTLSGD